MTDDIPITGPCCGCRQVGPLRNIVALHVRAPESARGKGWGCVVCGLPADGAIAVVCDPCAEQLGRPDAILDACTGYAGEPGRVPLVQLVEPFDHDLSRHPDESVIVT